MNWFLIGFLIYWAGWLVSIPFVLRERMEGERCKECLKGEWDHESLASTPIYRRDTHHKFQGVPLGSLRERNGGDAAASAGISLLWPAILAIVTLVLLVRWTGLLLGWMIKLTPLTASERRFKVAKLDRKIEHNDREIERLTKEISS